ncbi:MAG: hypothetical protein Q8L10_00080 [Candidatus Moranbacteria bacterium]|nr:hypothetical protein [Candidatus Moranbacteria bacterium]
MIQIVKFDTNPTENPEEVISYSRNVVNASSGIGMNELKQVVEACIPWVKNDKTITYKIIIHTNRYECPCCNTDISALVRVHCEGAMVKECDGVNGLYVIGIHPDHGGCKVIVEKLSATIIYQGRSSYLPKKDYAADPKVHKDLEDKYASIAEIARKNPNRAILVDGIETREDLDGLVKTTIEKISTEGGD